ncbi:hypothetical protein B7494_g1642 [Chlorociboria aeruginascens]|nr:hypothetical protein B7494_g1642 [Chlorociboria aeruginascens]
MAKTKFGPKGLGKWLEKRSWAIWENLLTNHLWQRMLKITLSTGIAILFGIIPSLAAVYGQSSFLAPMTTVFGHPGRRFGQMAEALVMAVMGTLIGCGWSMLGIFLSGLIYDHDSPAAYTIRGIFFVIALLFHGFLRSHTPRLWIFVLLFIIICSVSLTTTATHVTTAAVTQLLYPILSSTAVLLLVNILVFPEFSSDFLGITTIETLGETVGALRDAGSYFIKSTENNTAGPRDEGSSNHNTVPATAARKPVPKGGTNLPLQRKVLAIFEKFKRLKPTSNSNSGPRVVKLKSLTNRKAKLRGKLASCRAAQQECNYELAWSVLPPKELKPISVTSMKHLVANTIALIGACESKYALMGDAQDKEESESKDRTQLETISEESNVKTEDELQKHLVEDRGRPRGDRMDENRQDRKKSRSKSRKRLDKEKEDLELIKPRKEIESGDTELLKSLVSQIAQPLAELQVQIDSCVDAITACLGYCCDVRKLPSGSRPPTGINLQEIDVRVDILSNALTDFDRDSSAALEAAALMHDTEGSHIDVMPRMETFLISSFILNLRQAASHTMEMLKHTRVIVERCQARHDRKRLYLPQINWQKWLNTGGEEDMLALPDDARKAVRTGTVKVDMADGDPVENSRVDLLRMEDLESASPDSMQTSQSSIPENHAAKQKSKSVNKGTLFFRFRNGLADCLEYLTGSEDVLYAVKLTMATFLVTWPAFLKEWNEWYSLNRGIWAALQLILIAEVSLGTSIFTFGLRAVGTTLGCLWGFAAFSANNGNRIVCMVLLIIGIIPSSYVQLGSKYIKAGMVAIVSMAVVALATEDNSIPGSATENFIKRLVAFLIGGTVALLVEVMFFPVKARDRLVESLAGSIRQISEMEACLAYGVETETNVNVHTRAVSERFEHAKGKAQAALRAAETFLPFCASEPRLKGSFKGLALIYGEILYVLHAILDRMDNMFHLRKQYGSGVLEELNAQVSPYRRNVAGSITLILFAVHEALTTKLPLPQFLPSARLAHLRMVNRVREVVIDQPPTVLDELTEHSRSELETNMVKRIVRQKFLSWNAASAGQIEIIEYLEELIDLTKLLVGANEFRSGMLTRPTYQEYLGRMDGAYDFSRPVIPFPKITPASQPKPTKGEEDATRDKIPEIGKEPKIGIIKRRTTFAWKDEGEKKANREREKKEEEAEEKRRAGEEEQLPRSLQRVRTRRVEEMNLRVEKTWSSEKGRKT